MNKTQQQPIPSNMEKFHNAEQMWFWFVYSKSVQSDLVHFHKPTVRRICELLDVETMVTKLYLSGQFTEQDLAVMKRYGDKRRAPHQYVWSENRDAYVWKCAMEKLDVAARKNGWLD